MNSSHGLTADDIEHAALCLRAASSKPKVIEDALLITSREALGALLQEKATTELTNKVISIFFLFFISFYSTVFCSDQILQVKFYSLFDVRFR